jgi:enterochelin esterase family protein
MEDPALLYSHVREDGIAELHYPGHGPRSVHATGSFCGWQTPGVQLRASEHGFHGEVGPVPFGDVEYKFIVDGQWVNDPVNLTRRENAGGGGAGENSLLHRSHANENERGFARGALHHLRFHSPALQEVRGYVVYLPPGYASASRRFPTLYLLHGALDWEKTWLDKGDLAATLDRLRAEGAIGDLIVVMPRDNGDLFRGDQRAADYLARDVVGHVDFEFRTLAEPRRRALDGLSTGGFTSIVLGASRPDVFGSIGSMSGCHDRRTFELVHARAAAMRAASQRYRVFCGTAEPHLDTCRAVAEAIDRAGVSTEYAELMGTHDWPLWKSALADHVRFHWANLAG